MPASLARFLFGRTVSRVRRPGALRLTPLEDRFTPADIRAVAVAILDGSGTAVASTVNGGFVRVQATWETTNLADTDKYIVRFNLNGIDIDSAEFTGSGGINIQKTAVAEGWYAIPGGPATITATIDPLRTVVETDETNNAAKNTFTPFAADSAPPDAATGTPNTLPAKLIWPTDGLQNRDWSVGNYADVDPRGGKAADYKGAATVADGHRGVDINVGTVAKFDAGLAVFAAAAGTVSGVADGNADRGGGDNSVTVDFGNGWAQTYAHLAKNSITVAVGTPVKSGQVIGLVGASGTEPGVQVTTNFRGLPVETFFDPTQYYADIVTYQASLPTGITDSGISNTDVAPDLRERPADAALFGTTGKQDPRFWYTATHFKAGDQLKVQWYRPDGTVAAMTTQAVAAASLFTRTQWSLPAATAAAKVGDWKATLEVNGTEVVSNTFTVEAGAGHGQLRVFLEDTNKTYVVAGRTTPIDFASVAAGAAAKTVDINFSNTGPAALTLAAPVMPTGFSVVGKFPTSLAAGAATKVTFQADSANPGLKFGTVRIATGDPDTPEFDFTVIGTITGTTPAGQPAVGLPGPRGVNLRQNTGPVLVAPDATVTDIDSVSFGAGGFVRVGFVQPPFAGDVLSVRDQGSKTGEVGFAGGTVSYEGLAIGTAAGGTGGAPLVVTFNGFSTIPGVQAVLQNITFDNPTTGLTSAPRRLAITASDGVNVSGDAYRTVYAVTPPDVVRVGPLAAFQTAPVGGVSILLANAPDPATFTTADVSLTLDGGPNLLDTSVTLATTTGTQYLLGNLAPLTAVDGTYTLTVTATGIRTTAGTPGLGSKAITWTLDTVAPAVTVEQAATQPDPTNTPPFQFVVTFAEPVTGFDETDVVVTGTAGAGGVVVTPLPGGLSFTVDVTTFTSVGTVVVTVPAGAAMDAAGNLSTASVSVDNTVTYQTQPPNDPPTITPIANQSLAFNGNSGPLAYTVGDDITPAGALIVRATSDDPTLLPSSALVLIGSGATRAVVVAPTAGRSGTATVTLTVEDASGLQTTTTFTVTVAAGPAVPPTPPTLPPVVPPVVPPTTPPPPPPMVPPTTPPTTPPVVPPTSPPVVGLVGTTTLAVAGGVGGSGAVTLYSSALDTLGTITPFEASFTGGVRVATADFTGDGVADYVVGTGPGTQARLRIIDGATQRPVFETAPFETTFTGGILVAAGDVNGDGTPDVAVSADVGGGPRVRVFDGKTFRQFIDFFGIDDPLFRGGTRIALGDVNGDGKADLVVAAGFQGGPRVATYSGAKVATGEPFRLFGDFFGFEQSLRNGVYVAVGDINGDGFGEVIVGGGPNGGPRVTAYSGAALLQNRYTPAANFFAGDPANRGGVRVAVKNLDGDNRADIVVGSGDGAGGRVTGYLGANLTPGGAGGAAFDFDAVGAVAGGVFVG